jgi:hypothetical protein
VARKMHAVSFKPTPQPRSPPCLSLAPPPPTFALFPPRRSRSLRGPASHPLRQGLRSTSVSSSTPQARRPRGWRPQRRPSRSPRKSSACTTNPTHPHPDSPMHAKLMTRGSELRALLLPSSPRRPRR